MPTISGAFDEVRVSTEDQFLAAISNISARGATNALAALGGSICFVAPVRPSKTWIIPEGCPGLTIRAISRFPIQPLDAALAAVFDVRAEFVTIRDLFIYGDSTGYATRFVQTGATFSSGRTANNLRVISNDVFCDQVFVDLSAGNCDDATIEGNWQSEANASHSAAVIVDSPGARVGGNVLEDGGGDSITVSANGDHCRIVDNDTGGGDITTSASGGANAISDNIMRSGLVVPHATDGVGVNP